MFFIRLGGGIADPQYLPISSSEVDQRCRWNIFTQSKWHLAGPITKCKISLTTQHLKNSTSGPQEVQNLSKTQTSTCTWNLCTEDFP